MQARIYFAVIYQSNEMSDSTASWFTSARLHKASLGKVASLRWLQKLTRECLNPCKALSCSCSHYLFTSGFLSFSFFFFLISAVYWNVITKLLIFPFNHLWCICDKRWKEVLFFFAYQWELGRNIMWCMINQMHLGVLEVVNNEDCFSACI